MKIQKKIVGGQFGGGGRGVGLGLGCQGGLERRIEFFCENSKKKSLGGGVVSGGRVRGVRMDVNEELKFLRKFTKKFGGRVVRVGGGVFGLGGSG